MHFGSASRLRDRAQARMSEAEAHASEQSSLRSEAMRSAMQVKHCERQRLPRAVQPQRASRADEDGRLLPLRVACSSGPFRHRPPG